MIGYICLNERKIDLNHFRYEIGKIYKSKINCFDTLEDLLIYYHYQGSMRFFKVRFSEKNSTLLCNDVERIISEFKIVKEVDYSKLTNSDNYGIQLLSTEKNKEESMLEKFSSSDNPSALIAVINAGVDKYLDKLIKRNKSVSLILSKYKRKKDIETFINSKDLELVSIIASFGISFTYIFILPTMPMQKLTTTPLTFSPFFCLKIISLSTKNAHNNIVTYKQLTTRRNR